ncbi:MAG: DUF6635 family protein [Bacillota bacterium]
MNSEEFGATLGNVDACIEEFFASKRADIDSFVQNHFSLQETWQLQKSTVALDIVFYPLNTLWSIPYLTIKKTVEIIDKLGWASINSSLNYIPSGFKTRYQKRTEDLITKNLISTSAAKDLLQAIDQSARISNSMSPTALNDLEYKISALIKKEIDNHTSSQILVTDLITSAATLLAGKWLFGDSNLSIMGMGSKMARKFANEKASERFFLGKHAGSVFYKAFTVAPTKTQIYIATASIGLLLTVFSLAAAVLSDPLRKRLGLHQKKLNALMDSLEEKIFLLVKAELKRETARAVS